MSSCMAHDYIKRQDAIKELLVWKKAMELRGRSDDADTYEHSADLMCSIPAADVVEVVRCKDCRFFDNKEGYTPFCGYCNAYLDDIYDGDIDENFYCERGERKKEKL